MTTTPILGLNKPAKGDFDWDIPINENWDKLDALGAGRMPFMAPLLMEHLMDEEDSVGWALQGSTLDGDVYTTAWEKLLTAKNRASTETKTYKGISYDILVDSVTKWRFVSKETYDNAKENLGNSLGFVVDYVDGAKRIILPYRSGFLSLGDEPGVYTPEGLPNITGTLNGAQTTSHGTYQNATGAFNISDKATWTWGHDGAPTSSSIYRDSSFDASRSNEIYGASEHVTPENTSMYLYYRVADTVSVQATLDMAGLLAQISALSARVEALEGGE